MINKISSKYSLFGKTALITGAGGMLGQEHALALLECGAMVVLTDINEKSLIRSHRELAGNINQEYIRTEVMDVSSYESISKVARKLSAEKIRLDILINNAAIDPKVNTNGIAKNLRLENFSLEQWNQQLAVGLTGAFLCSQIFGSLMASDNKGGVILNIASDLSVIAPDQRLYREQDLTPDQQPVKPVTYSVIKTGLIGLTRYLATYWAEAGVRANALSPGGVYSEQSEKFVKHLTSLIPLGRMAKSDEYRAAVQFLCSDASSYMTGQNIVMDGGRSVL
jgi:NAD(P)-dependent dehydrogenase (short-subunit alcohol dehydrogenase family)